MSEKFPYPSQEEFAAMTIAEFVSFWDAFAKLEIIKTAPFNGGRWFLGRNDIRDLITLKQHGWTPAPQDHYSQPMSWFWRRPLRRGSRDRLGQMFKSTGQAISALRQMHASDGQMPITDFKMELMIDGQPHYGTLPARGRVIAQYLAQSIHAKLVD